MSTEEKRISVLAVDPGETLGWYMAWVCPGKFNVEHSELSIISPSWGLITTFEGFQQINEWTFQRANYVVMENYLVYPAYALRHTGSNMITSQMLGVCKWLAWEGGATTEVQLAATAKHYWPVARMRKYLPNLTMCPSVPTPKTDGALGSHEVDALRHWLTFVERKGWVDFTLIREEDIV